MEVISFTHLVLLFNSIVFFCCLKQFYRNPLYPSLLYILTGFYLNSSVLILTPNDNFPISSLIRVCQTIEPGQGRNDQSA